jgi:hypothetical protein
MLDVATSIPAARQTSAAAFSTPVAAAPSELGDLNRRGIAVRWRT